MPQTNPVMIQLSKHRFKVSIFQIKKVLSSDLFIVENPNSLNYFLLKKLIMEKKGRLHSSNKSVFKKVRSSGVEGSTQFLRLLLWQPYSAYTDVWSAWWTHWREVTCNRPLPPHRSGDLHRIANYPVATPNHLIFLLATKNTKMDNEVYTYAPHCENTSWSELESSLREKNLSIITVNTRNISSKFA